MPGKYAPSKLDEFRRLRSHGKSAIKSLSKVIETRKQYEVNLKNENFGSVPKLVKMCSENVHTEARDSDNDPS